jgi:hypothetical protein
VLVLALVALAGSFMVSYSSAKAEALHQPVPPGVMRRPERALCLCSGVALSALLFALERVALVPSWAARAPIVTALAVVAVLANASGIVRLRSLARSSAPSRTAAAREQTMAVASLGLEPLAANEAAESNPVAAPRVTRVH